MRIYFLAMLFLTFCFKIVNSQDSIVRKIDSLIETSTEQSSLARKYICDTLEEYVGHSKELRPHIVCIEAFLKKETNTIVKLKRYNENDFYKEQVICFFDNNKIIKIEYKNVFPEKIHSERVLYFINDIQILQKGIGQPIIPQYYLGEMYELKNKVIVKK